MACHEPVEWVRFVTGESRSARQTRVSKLRRGFFDDRRWLRLASFRAPPLAASRTKGRAEDDPPHARRSAKPQAARWRFAGAQLVRPRCTRMNWVRSARSRWRRTFPHLAAPSRTRRGADLALAAVWAKLGSFCHFRVPWNIPEHSGRFRNILALWASARPRVDGTFWNIRSRPRSFAIARAQPIRTSRVGRREAHVAPHLHPGRARLRRQTRTTKSRPHKKPRKTAQKNPRVGGILVTPFARLRAHLRMIRRRYDD